MALAVVAGSLLLPFAAQLLSPHTGTPYPEADGALLEIGTLRATQLRQLLGPFSRFGWRHPGPLLFYAFAPAYQLSGHDTLSLYWATALVNGAALLGIVLLARAAAGARGTLTFGLLAGAYFAYLGPPIVGSDWNPYVPILPFALLIVAGAAVATGRLRLLPLVALLASFVVQSHVIYGPSAGAVSVAVLVAAVWRARREPSRLAMPLLWTLGVLVVAWAPSLFEELRDRPGNLSAVAAYASRAGIHHSLVEAASLVAGQAAWPFSPLGTALAWPAFALQVVLLVGGVLWAARWALHFEAALCALVLLVYAAAVRTLVGVDEPLKLYYALWLSATAMVGWAALASIAVARLRPSPALGRGLSAAVLALSLILGVSTAFTAWRGGLPLPGSSPDVGAASDAVVTWLRARPGQRPLVVIGDDSWSEAAGVVLALEKAGMHVAVEDRWLVLYGREFAPRGDERLELRIGDPSLLEHPPAGGTLIAAAGRIVVYALGA